MHACTDGIGTHDTAGRRGWRVHFTLPQNRHRCRGLVAGTVLYLDARHQGKGVVAIEGVAINVHVAPTQPLDRRRYASDVQVLVTQDLVWLTLLN